MILLYLILILNMTIFIHELGHFLFAKKAGIYVYEFSLGMGPKLFHFKRKNDETEYAIRLFPIGGFVQMAGEEIDVDENIPLEKRMQSKTWMQRFLTIIAGVLFNFLLAFILLFVVALMSGAPDTKAYLGKIHEGYPASNLDLQVGDVITHLNGKRVSSSDMFLLELQINQGKTIEITVKHENGEKLTTQVKPQKELEKGKSVYKYGFSLENHVEKGIIPSIKYAFNKTGALLNQMVHIIGYLCTGKLGIDSLAGPVGIYTIVGESARAGVVSLIYLVAYLCINVGFINLLPIPAFDGGRIFFMIIEKIRGKALNPKTENIIHSIGLIVLMALMILITGQDIIRLFT